MSIAAVLQADHEPPEPPRHLRSVGEPGPGTSERVADGSAAPQRTILIVEDEPGLRESLREIFRLEGYATVEAENGRKALQLLHDQEVDVLILDLHLPKVDGVGVLQQIDPPPPIVIVHSAFEFYSREQVGAGVGPKVFRTFQKPIPPRQLIAAVAEAVIELEGMGE